MIRLGFSRWFLKTKTTIKYHRKHYGIEIIPQYHSVTILKKTYRGLHEDLQPTTINLKTLAYDCFLSLDVAIYPKCELDILAKMANEVSYELVEECLSLGLIQHEGVNKTILMGIVRRIIIQHLQQKPHTEEFTQDNNVNLVNQMQDVIDERRRAKEIREEAQRLKYEAINKEKATFTKTSFDLLRSFLNKDELKELESNRCVTIKYNNNFYRIPSRPHGLVEQIKTLEDGRRVIVNKYCIVFKDYTIPIGDEMLMKIAMLKLEPENFFKIANSFTV